MSIYDFKVTARDGNFLARFEPTISMKKVAAAVAEAL